MLFAIPWQQEKSSEAARLNRVHPRGSELAALLVMLLSLVASTIINHRLIRPLAALYAEIGREFPLPLQTYLTVTHLTALWVMVGLLLVALAVARARAVRAVLFCVAAVAALNTLLGLWSVADTGVQHARQLEIWKTQIMVERDLATLHLAAGQPQAVIDLIDPKRTGDCPIRTVGAAGRAFQLAEAYRLAGNIDAARRLYRRAEEAANLLDESTRHNPEVGGNDLIDLVARLLRTHSILSQHEPWQTEAIRDLRRLPDIVRAVSEQRLHQLPDAETPKPASVPSPH